jgi:preprotein translocase subunit YajC
LTDLRDNGIAKLAKKEEKKMDDTDKKTAAIAVGTKVRLRDGREGNVTEVKGNQIVVTTGDGNTIEAPMGEAEAVDAGAPEAD